MGQEGALALRQADQEQLQQEQEPIRLQVKQGAPPEQEAQRDSAQQRWEQLPHQLVEEQQEEREGQQEGWKDSQTTTQNYTAARYAPLPIPPVGNGKQHIRAKMMIGTAPRMMITVIELGHCLLIGQTTIPQHLHSGINAHSINVLIISGSFLIRAKNFDLSLGLGITKLHVIRQLNLIHQLTESTEFDIPDTHADQKRSHGTAMTLIESIIMQNSSSLLRQSTYIQDKARQVSNRSKGKTTHHGNTKLTWKLSSKLHDLFQQKTLLHGKSKKQDYE